MTTRTRVPAFAAQQREWSAPPVDDVGYIPSADLLAYPDERLRTLVERFEESRYQGERNRDNVWRDVLGLDSTHDSTVLDYGCGTGVEALQYAKAGNTVFVADIAPDNVALACRVSSLYGYTITGLDITEAWPFIEPATSFDVIHCSGALHHIPEPRPVVERFTELLKPGGELRLMLYSDVAWRKYTGSEPPDDVTDHPGRAKFVGHMDSVGGWADWYDRDRLDGRFGDLLTVDRVEYMMEDRTFLAATLLKRSGQSAS